MSSKISALPAATVFNNTDVLDGLVAGANNKITRDVFLTANGQQIQLLSNTGGFVLLTASGEIDIRSASGHVVHVSQPAGSFLDLAADGTVVLSGINTKNVQLVGFNGDEFLLVGDGSVVVKCSSSKGVTFLQGTATWLQIDTTGGVFIAPPSGVLGLAGIAGCGISFDASGAVFISAAPGQVVTIDYSPGTPADWVGPAPIDLADAIDRIARVVSAFGATPIP